MSSRLISTTVPFSWTPIFLEPRHLPLNQITSWTRTPGKKCDVAISLTHRKLIHWAESCGCQIWRSFPLCSGGNGVATVYCDENKFRDRSYPATLFLAAHFTPSKSNVHLSFWEKNSELARRGSQIHTLWYEASSGETSVLSGLSNHIWMQSTLHINPPH